MDNIADSARASHIDLASRDPNQNIRMYVHPYEYRPDGKGVEILAEGGLIIASVRGTSYPLGSACQSDVDLARVMAAAPEMLAALEFIAPYLDALPIYAYERLKIRAALAKALQS